MGSAVGSGVDSGIGSGVGSGTGSAVGSVAGSAVNSAAGSDIGASAVIGSGLSVTGVVLPPAQALSKQMQTSSTQSISSFFIFLSSSF